MPEPRITKKAAWGRLSALALETVAQATRGATDPVEQARRRAWALADARSFNATYLPHYFRTAPAPFHEELYRAIEGHRRVVVRAPRGHAKSTVMTFAYTLHQVVCAPALKAWEQGGWAGLEEHDAALCAALRDEVEPALRAQGRALAMTWDPYIQIIAVTVETALEFTSSIKTALEMNERLIGDWSTDGRPLVSDPGHNYDDFVCQGTRVKAFGMNAAIRGGKHEEWRPTLAIVDDPDSRATIGSERVRDKQLRHILSAVKYGLDPQKSRVFIAGTPLHYDCVVCRLTDPSRYNDWLKLRFSARKPDGQPLWPEVWSKADLDREERENPDDAGAELFDTPPDDGQRAFPVELPKYSRKDLVAGLTVVFCDPSLARSAKSDLQGLVGIRVTGPDVRLLHAEGLRLAPQLLVKHVAEVSARLQADATGIETISAQELFLLLLDPEDQAMMGPWHRVDSHAESKLGRIRSLGPWFTQGRARLPDDDSCQIVERHARQFPDGPLDVLDALEMAIRLARHLMTGSSLRITARLPGRASALTEQSRDSTWRDRADVPNNVLRFNRGSW